MRSPKIAEKGKGANDPPNKKKQQAPAQKPVFQEDNETATKFVKRFPNMSNDILKTCKWTTYIPLSRYNDTRY